VSHRLFTSHVIRIALSSTFTTSNTTGNSAMDASLLAQRIYNDTKDTACGELRADMLEAAVRYSRYRAEWALASHEKRVEMDQGRFRAHQVLIDSFNILSRGLARHGEDNSWRGDLGDERRAIGDVACHLHCMLAISAR